MRAAILHDIALLPCGVQFDLIDGRVLSRFVEQPVEVLGHEIADAERAHTAVFAQCAERLPRLAAAPVERRGPVDHVHVHVIELQQFERMVERAHGGIIALLGIAQFRGHPQRRAPLACVVTGRGERAPHALLVVVSGGAVDVPVADFQRRFDDRYHTFVVDAQHTQPDLRDLRAVVQGDEGDVRGPFRERAHKCAFLYIYDRC